jgi:hypothetical protein
MSENGEGGEAPPVEEVVYPDPKVILTDEIIKKGLQ